MTDTIKIVADTFALAKDAPTSFEDENWLEGFEDARCMIAVRLAAELEQSGAIESASDFLDACGIPKDETECATCREQIETQEFPCDECGSIDSESGKTECGQCEGTGTTDAMGKSEECPVCDGTGQVAA